MSEPTIFERFQRWHHESRWAKLNSLITSEAPTEYVRKVIRESGDRKERFIIQQPELRRALGLKTDG